MNADVNSAVTMTYSLQAPSIPAAALYNAIALLLNAYGVSHTLPLDSGISSESLTTGNNVQDARLQNDYIMFKSFLDGLSLQYKDISCNAVGSTVGVHMTFICCG